MLKVSSNSFFMRKLQYYQVIKTKNTLSEQFILNITWLYTLLFEHVHGFGIPCYLPDFVLCDYGIDTLLLKKSIQTT
jgi:hypothetical protein